MSQVPWPYLCSVKAGSIGWKWFIQNKSQKEVHILEMMRKWSDLTYLKPSYTVLTFRSFFLTLPVALGVVQQEKTFLEIDLY